MAIVAGVLSVVGGLYAFWQHIVPQPTTGQVIAVIREMRTARPVSEATLEILTPKDELVTTLTAPESGRLQHALKEGSARVSHQVLAENRTIQVVPRADGGGEDRPSTERGRLDARWRGGAGGG